MNTAEIRLDFPEAEQEIICSSIMQDINNTERAITRILKSRQLKIQIEAKDLNALRAGINTILRLIKVSEDNLKVK